MLIKLKIKYGSKESINIINSVFKCIAVTAVETSLQLAKMEGCYPMCNKQALVESSFIKALNLPENTLKDIAHYGLFNNQLLTCAPTGSIATMIQVSTGVEPNYAFSFTRRTVSLNEKETYYQVDADIVKQYKDRWRNTNNDELPEFFVSSQQIPWWDRIDVQAALQTWIDASISSTVNLKEETTVTDVAELYLYAWQKGLKGITIWRNNCQRQGILSTENEKDSNQEISEALSASTENAKQLVRGEIIKSGDHWIGLKRTLSTGCGSLHVESFWDPINGELREIYLSKGSTGGCNNYMISLSRMISLAARGGIGIEHILDQLKSCGVCPSYAVRTATKHDTSKGSCCPVAVGNALRDMYNEIQDIICECNSNKEESNIFRKSSKMSESVESLEECPVCHEKTLIHQGGCVSCTSCSYSKCE